MKIVSWNLNGLRATVNQFEGQSLKGLLQSLQADLICLQETKTTREQLDSSLYLVEGYNAYFSFCRVRKGYSGVVTFCHNSAHPVAAEEGLTGTLPSCAKDDVINCYGELEQFTQEELSLLDREGRAVLTEHCVTLGGGGSGLEEKRRLVVVNVYCPMYDPARDKEGEGLARRKFKKDFYQLLESRVSALERAGKLVLVVGDLNCYRETIDSAYVKDDPTHNKSQDRVSLDQFITSQPPSTHSSPSTSLLDTFRYLHPSQEQAYTCWSTLLDCRKTNFGTRIDYILASTCLAPRVLQAEVWQHMEGSDHCPVFSELDLHLLQPLERRLPSLCSDYFSGKQIKLSTFLSCRGKEDGIVSGAKHSLTHSPPPPSAKHSKLSKSHHGVKQTLYSAEEPEKKIPSTSSPGALQGDSEKEIPSTNSPGALQGNSPSMSSPSFGPKQGGLNEAWKSVFSGPPKPPQCVGHREPCVLRKVKKQGANRDRGFWVCARPMGGKRDPLARCDHFQWAKEKK